MATVRTFRFHAKYGPDFLFDKAREQLKDLAGLSLEIPHAKSRVGEREIPLKYLSDFQPDGWELMTVETAARTGRIAYVSLRQKLGSTEYLWVVLASKHVITAWIRQSPRDGATSPRIVRDGPAWDAAADGRTPKMTRAQAEWESAYFRRVRAQRVLDALAIVPERPSGDRLALAARLVLAGGTWNEAAVGAGWLSRQGMDGAIVRLFRAVGRSGLAGGGG